MSVLLSLEYFICGAADHRDLQSAARDADWAAGRKCLTMQFLWWSNIHRWQVSCVGKEKRPFWNWWNIGIRRGKVWIRSRVSYTGRMEPAGRTRRARSWIWVKCRLCMITLRIFRIRSFIMNPVADVRFPAAIVSPRLINASVFGIWNWSKRSFSFSLITKCRKWSL